MAVRHGEFYAAAVKYVDPVRRLALEEKFVTGRKYLRRLDRMQGCESAIRQLAPMPACAGIRDGCMRGCFHQISLNLMRVYPHRSAAHSDDSHAEQCGYSQARVS